ncbi:flavin reductase family protein [Candidatus Woesearchaeota archaeon]|nr:flavin reductase family protein [Candidatus Woesearchaeota archaeon]
MIELEIKEVFGKIRPHPVVFVITVDGRGSPTGMACGWHMKTNLNPPLYTIALKTGSHTEELIKKSQEFVIAFPSKLLEEELVYFGTRSGREFDKFKETKIKTRKSKNLQSPLLEEATINLECFLYKTITAADHTIIIGRVVAAHHKPGQKLLFTLGRKDKERYFKEL